MVAETKESPNQSGQETEEIGSALRSSRGALVGRRATIVVSGCVFAALHVAYGNVGPDNAIAGFILGWAFLKSRAIVVPVALHFLGNLLVGTYHIGLCYLSI